MSVMGRHKIESEMRSFILDRLKDSVQSLIHGPGGENIPRLSSNAVQGPIFGHTDNTNLLCCVLEAIFIHGLKSSFGERLTSIFADFDRMPAPNFWHVVMVISHRDLIKKVQSLNYIVTDVGKGRAWIRHALNEGQLISYLSILASDSQTLKDYYKPSSLLRDTENCDIMLRILNPLSAILFNLSLNSSVLNAWSQISLSFAGLWTPKCEDVIAPVLSATDIASTVFEKDTSDTFEAGTGSHTPLSDHMFDMIIGSTPDTKFITDTSIDYNPFFTKIENKDSIKSREFSDSESLTSNFSISNLESSDLIFTHSNIETCVQLQAEQNNSENIKEISFDNINPSFLSNINTTDDNLNNNKKQENQKRTRKTIDTLARDTERKNKVDKKVSSNSQMSGIDNIMNRSISVESDFNVEYKNLLAEFNSTDKTPHMFTSSYASINPVSAKREEVSEIGSFEEVQEFEFLSQSPITNHEESFFSQLMNLVPEKGFDEQNFQCGSTHCSVSLGVMYAKWRLCHFDGRHYCSSCHAGATSRIPSKIIHNWDFKPYPVCDAHKVKLDNFSLQPIINLRQSNTALYRHVGDLSKIQVLRLELHFIQAYLFTCKSGIGNELRKKFWPREHLFEHIHMFSVQDLKDIENGKLLELLKCSAETFKKHILNCRQCKSRGFVCEVCNKDEIIFPFQLNENFNCEFCYSVYHKTCVNLQKNCPKCKRISKRRNRDS